MKVKDESGKVGLKLNIQKIKIMASDPIKMKVKEESGKVGLKLNIQKTKIMASGPITSWQVDRETCTPWGHKELDMTEWLNWTDIYIYIFFYQILFHYSLLQDIEYRPQCYIIGPCCLFYT